MLSLTSELIFWEIFDRIGYHSIEKRLKNDFHDSNAPLPDGKGALLYLLKLSTVCFPQEMQAYYAYSSALN